MIENINDRYIQFKCSFTSEDGLYNWEQEVKYRLVGKDDNGYYIGRHNLDPYRISKELEDVAYEIGDIKKDNRK